MDIYDICVTAYMWKTEDNSVAFISYSRQGIMYCLLLYVPGYLACQHPEIHLHVPTLELGDLDMCVCACLCLVSEN